MREPALSPAAFARAANEATPEDQSTLSELVAAHYVELREMARRASASEAAGNSLNPTALISEAFLRLVKQEHISAKGWNFVRACIATEYRRILIDHARRKQTKRRGGDWHRESSLHTNLLGRPGDFDAYELSDLLDALAIASPRRARVAELRILAEMTEQECADVLGVSRRTVVTEWKFAYTWLMQRLLT